MNVVQAFIELSYSEKISKLRNVMQIFANHSQVAAQTIELIDKNPQALSEDDSIQLYTLLMQTVEDTESESMDKAIAYLNHIHQKILAIQAAESEQKKQENPDDILMHI
jgi:hypothetical protein